MKLNYAIDIIDQAVLKMCFSSGSPIFNEWMIVGMSNRNADILFYSGPRSSSAQKKMQSDMRSLEEEMTRDGFASGNFFFSPDAAGTLYDAFIVAGSHKYIIFNNTTKTMREISADPFWGKTQIYFVELSERFYSDPLG